MARRGRRDAPDQLDVLARRGLVERNAQRPFIGEAEVRAGRFRARNDVGGGSAGRDGQRVEEFARGHGETEPAPDPSRRIAVSRCTRRAIPRRPSGP
jgi:hypothetical protein